MTEEPENRPAGEPPPQPRQYVGLLTQIMTNTLDEDYETVARSKKASEQSPTDGTRKANHRGAMIAVLAAFGVLIGISALKTDQDRTETNAERAELVVQIHNREDHLAGLRATSSSLENDVTRLQGSVEAQITRITTVNGQVGDLGLVAGMFAAQGQGIVVTVDDAPAAQRGSGGVILDSDLQALVNALWVSGAEAISIDGHRLTSVTSIRFAGQAITVDYRSLTPPYVISAIGNPDTLPARLLETAGGQTWLGLKTNFGIRFDTETKDNITVPADPHEHLLYARAVPR